MNPIQESKQELEASIRYAENAISKAKQTIESMATYQEQTGREEALQNQVDDLRASAFEDAKTIEQLKEEREMLEKNVKYLRDENERLERDVTVKTIQAEAWKKEYDKLKEGAPTMPVIPKAVAIAIFREGAQHGVEAACTELEGQTIMVEESDYVGNFEVSFTKEIDLDDELDLDWVRGKIGRYDEGFVTDALRNLCADKEFECRIHGVDDQEEKKND